MSTFVYSRAFYTPSSGSRMGPVARISVRLRILATLRRQRPAIIRSILAPALRLATERKRQKETAARLGRVSGFLGQLQADSTASHDDVRSSRFPTRRIRRQGTTAGG